MRKISGGEFNVTKSKLTEIYKRFGFTEENTGNESIAVYSIKTGHYHNADILPLNNEVNVNQTFEEYRQLGYACQIKNISLMKKHIRNYLMASLASIQLKKG